MTTPIFSDLLASCTYSDREAAAVADLVAKGIGQWDASLVIYGATPAWDAPMPVWRVWAAQQVADMFAPLRKVVGL